MTTIPLPSAGRGRERVIPTLVGILDALLDLAVSLHSIDARLARLERRPPTVVEWKPNHRRAADGGESVRRQRARAKK